jgi:hypothetical protein
MFQVSIMVELLLGIFDIMFDLGGMVIEQKIRMK